MIRNSENEGPDTVAWIHDLCSDASKRVKVTSVPFVLVKPVVSENSPRVEVSYFWDSRDIERRGSDSGPSLTWKTGRSEDTHTGIYSVYSLFSASNCNSAVT